MQVLSAVQRDGRMLKFASRGLKDDADVVLAAVSECGDALQFASDEMRSDERVR